MNHISTVIPTKSHYLLKGPWVTLNHFSLCFSAQFKAILLPFLFLQMRLDDLIWSEREGKKQEREEILNKRKGLSQKLISKEDFSAWLTSFFFFLLWFFYKSKHSIVSWQLLYIYQSLMWRNTNSGEVKSCTDVLLSKFYDSVHF